MWVVFLMAGEESFTRPCPFCPLSFTFSERYTLEQAEAWIVANHLPGHAGEMTLPALSRVPTGGAMCTRCHRYAGEVVAIPPGHKLHRACYAVGCLCPCSPVPAKEVSQ